MKKLNAKRLAALAMTLVMLLGVLTACGDKADTNNGSGDGEGFPTMTIQIAHVNPTTDDDQYNKLATLFAEKVTAATDGAVTFEICGNSELGGEADVLTGFDLGTHQMGIITNGSYGNLYGPSGGGAALHLQGQRDCLELPGWRHHEGSHRRPV